MAGRVPKGDDSDDDRGGGHRRAQGPTLIGLRAFVAVVETGSFSRAAERLGIGQPSVSMQVRTLEQACGLRLLHRRGRLVLTDHGRDLLIRARLVLSRVEEFEQSVRDLRALRRGRVAVGFSTPPYALAVLARFMEQQPEVEIATRLGNTDLLLADIADCRIDIGIMTLREPHPAFANVLLARQQLILCVRAGHPWAEGGPVGLDDLRGRAMILRERGSMTREIFEAACAAAGIAPAVRLELGSREAVKEAAASGLGIGIVLDGEFGHDARLRPVALAGVPGDAGVYAVCLRESLEIPAIAAFLEIAAAVLPATG